MPDNRYYYFKDAKGNRHTVNKAAFDNDREGFAKAFPGARMEVIDRKTGRRGDVDVKDAGRVGDFGAHLFTGQTVRRGKYQPKTSLGKAAQRVAQEKWGKEESGAEPGYASLSLPKPLGNGDKESALVKGLREADALKRRDEEQMPIDYTKPSAVKQMVGRTRREQQMLDRRIEQAGREAGKEVMKPLREKEARLKTPVVDTGDANVNAHVINTQEQAERQLVESGLEFANKHLYDYVSDNILNEFKTATAKGAAAESALSKVSPFAYMAAGKAYNEALDPDKLLKHLQEKANADIAKVLSQPKMQEEIGLKAAAYGISPEEYVEKSLIPGLQAKLAADFDKSELSRSMPKSTAEYILRGVNESMLGTIMSMGMTSKKQRQYAQQGMAMTDNGENPNVNPGMAARVARGTLGFVADAPVFGAAGKAGAAVAGKVFGNGVAQTARIANSTLGGRIARMAGSGMVSQGVTGVLYGSTNAAVQNYSTGDDTSIGNTVKVMAMGGLSEGASWATMGGIGGAVGAGIYNVSGVKRIPAKAFQLAMEGIGMHMGGNVAKTIEGHDTDWLSVEGNLEACANVVALKLTHARLPKRQSKDGVKESYLDMVARNINGLMTSDGQRAAFGGYTFTNEEKEQLFGSASAPKRNESIYGYDAHNNPLTRKESLTSWAMRAKKTAAKGKGEESYKDTDAEFVKTAYDEIMADNTIPWDTKAKFSALVMGTVPSARPMMENCRIEGGSVNEYSKNGELLSKNSFKSIDERNSIIYSLNMKREDQRLSNAYGAAQIKDEKTAQATLEAVAEANGMTAEQLKAAMDKQPLRRSDEEQNACVALRKAYEDEQFVPGTLHAEQSNTEGKDVVEENNLGTENPNNEAVAKVLGDLTKAEDALQAAMDGNDVLKEEYERMQKAGMSNPQIYMELFNAGLTQEQLATLADYINTLSKAQGMFKGTQDKIVETTQKHVGQWSYKGELNGEKQNGEQMVFVKDNKGRVLIVGAGDVAFDGEGRVRDGDMLTVYDPATREMDFVHAKDVTLERTTSSEEYAKDYQRQLEELNSTVYAEMQQQDGKPNEASLSQTKPGEQPVGEEGNEALLGLSKPTEPLEGRIAETVEKVSKQTGGNVKMVNSVEEIGNEQVRRDIENGKQVTGWYDENTGEVHLYMPNIHDSYTAEKTVWHETVGHKGMRGLLGDKFNDYMRGLWMDLDNPVNAELRAYVKERMGKDSMGFYDAIEEFIAESAEKGKGEPGFWNNIKNKVTDALHEIGYRISPNVKDVKYMLWLAKNVQKKGNDPWWKMRADAVKWKIEHENVEYTKIHGGEFYENDGKNHDFEDMTKEEWDEATDGQIHYRTAPSAATALDRYHSMLNAHGYMATEAFMDNMLSLEKLMKAVDPSIKKIEDVKSSMNPYVLQNTMQGAMSDKMTLFEHQVMKPLDKAMGDVLDSFAGKNTEEKIRECNLYMIGKHGLERNRVLFVRDWFRKTEKTEDVDDAGLDNLDRIWKGERSDLRRKLDSGQIDLREYYRQMDEWIVQNIDKDFKAEEHDYSGMHGLQEIDDLKSPYDDAGAIDSVMSQEAKMESLKKGSVDNLWNRIKDATNYSINSDYENGLMSEELRDRVASMFDWYVPLRKFDEATAEDVYGYISGEDGKGFIGETLMNAKGRKSLSDVNVLAQIGAMANRAIRNGGQNAVKQAFARFVRNSGIQNLVKETKVWVEKTGTDVNGNDIWEEAYPQIPDNANAHDIATIVDAFETDMKTKQAKGEAKTLSNSTDIGFKFARAKNKSEHFVDVKIAGRTHRFVVLGNPRAAQALNGMLENSSPKSALLKGLKSATRFMAQMATSYSPEFVMRNIIRDAEFASSNVTAKEGVRYGLKWARYYAELNPLNIFYNEGAGALKNLKWKDLKEGVGIGLYARYREGTLGDSKMERYFKEFMQNGGETGWVQVKTMQEWEKEYKRDVSRERSNVSKAGKMLRDVLVGNVENLNEMAENMARFATFCTSRDLGRSAVRSAYDAKQVSTNFNRHGSGDAIKTFKNGEMGAGKEMRRNVYGFIASYLRNYSMFFNAGVQSTHLLMNNVKKAPVGTIASMMAMPFGLGILAAAVNNAMIANEDEKKRKGVQDPYGELPEYIRRNNLCIYKGGGKFVTIPLAIELRAFYGLGDIAAGITTAKNVKSTRNVAMDAVGCMSQLLPVVDFTNTSAFDKEPGKETLKGVLPTAAAPFVEWWLNSDWKGAPIRREGDYTENRPAWMNAYSGTPEKLMDLNKWVNAKTNDVAPGNENMRGNSLLDEATDPAMLNHIIGTIGGGAATFMTRGTGLVLKYADGREQEIETKDIPFLRSLMYTPSEQTSMARTKAKWYSYKESMEKNMSNYSMLKNKNVPLTERIRNAADRHRFEQSADYARIRIIKDAEKQMKRWNKMKRLNADDKKQVDFANKNIEMIMQKAVEQMDGISEE